MFIGLGTVANVVTRAPRAPAWGCSWATGFPQRTRDTITDVLGLITMVLHALGAHVVLPAMTDAVGSGTPMLIVLGSLLIGAVVGSGLRIEDRLEGAADRLHRRSAGTGEAGTFISAVVTPTLLFCVGPLDHPRLAQRRPGPRRRAAARQVGARRVCRDRLRQLAGLGRAVLGRRRWGCCRGA